MNKVFEIIKISLFPKRCALCGSVVAFDETLCEKCKTAHRISRKACRKCGREPDTCTCRRPDFFYEGFAAPYYFEGSISEGVYRLKSYGFKELSFAMGDEISKAFKERFYKVPVDIVCFVPMTKKKQRKRGFNQSELLAKRVAENLGVECQSLLVKTRETKSQRKSGADSRRINLIDAFEANQDVKDKVVLVVDDVRTTGSTLNECAKALKRAGAKAVFCAAFTVTNKKHLKNR